MQSPNRQIKITVNISAYTVFSVWVDGRVITIVATVTGEIYVATYIYVKRKIMACMY